MKLPFYKPWLAPQYLRRARDEIARGQVLNLMEDAVFKDVFAADTEDSRGALRHLLSACTRRPVSGIRILNTEMSPDYTGGKSLRMDVHTAFNQGEQADLEMQRRKTPDDLRARASLYAARMLSNQPGAGDAYADIKRVYQIFFLNCVLFPGPGKLSRRYCLREKDAGDVLNETLEIIFYELPRLNRPVRAILEGKLFPQNLSTEEKWCIFIKYRKEPWAGSLMRELCAEEEGIMFAERMLNKVSRDQEKWARQFFLEKRKMDYRSEMTCARRSGIAEGIAKGAAEEKFEMARKLKKMGDTAEKIQAVTGLSPEDIEKL
jgi:predicted transposase/invertase (TIGR01784 family)